MATLNKGKRTAIEGVDLQLKPPLPNSKTIIAWARTPRRLCTLEGTPPKPRGWNFNGNEQRDKSPALALAPATSDRHTGAPGVAQSLPTYDSHKWPGTGGSVGQRHGGASS